MVGLLKTMSRVKLAGKVSKQAWRLPLRAAAAAASMSWRDLRGAMLIVERPMPSLTATVLMALSYLAVRSLSAVEQAPEWAEVPATKPFKPAAASPAAPTPLQPIKAVAAPEAQHPLPEPLIPTPVTPPLPDPLDVPPQLIDTPIAAPRTKQIQVFDAHARFAKVFNHGSLEIDPAVVAIHRDSHRL